MAIKAGAVRVGDTVLVRATVDEIIGDRVMLRILVLAKPQLAGYQRVNVPMEEIERRVTG